MVVFHPVSASATCSAGVAQVADWRRDVLAWRYQRDPCRRNTRTRRRSWTRPRGATDGLTCSARSGTDRGRSCFGSRALARRRYALAPRPPCFRRTSRTLAVARRLSGSCSVSPHPSRRNRRVHLATSYQQPRIAQKLRPLGIERRGEVSPRAPGCIGRVRASWS